MKPWPDSAVRVGAALAVFPVAFPAARAASYEGRRMGAHSYDVRSVVPCVIPIRSHERAFV